MSSLCSGLQNSLDDWASRSRCSRSLSRSPPDLENEGRLLNWKEEWVLLSWGPDEDSCPPADLGTTHNIQKHWHGCKTMVWASLTMGPADKHLAEETNRGKRERMLYFITLRWTNTTLNESCGIFTPLLELLPTWRNKWEEYLQDEC